MCLIFEFENIYSNQWGGAKM